MQALEVAQVGWDIGGAHVKVAAVDAGGRVVAALQVPCALWRGLDQLESALQQALAALPATAADARHAATMTGELADLFADRSQGVQRIVETLQRLCVQTRLRVFAGAIEFEGLRIPLMAEHFATTADVYRLTGELDERHDQHPSADSAEKTLAGSARRLARMIGRD